jgi:hypothetical protein
MQVRMQNEEPLNGSTDRRVFKRQPGPRVRGPEPGGSLCRRAGLSGPTGVFPARQKATRCNPGISEQTDGTQSAADDAADPAAEGERLNPSGAAHTTAVRHALHVGLLAEVDRVHRRLNGPSTRRILQRNTRSLAGKTSGWRECVPHLQTETRSGIPKRDSGFRVHQADWRLHRRAETTQSERSAALHPHRHRTSGGLGRVKGACHINALDTVTQWETAGLHLTADETALLSSPSWRHKNSSGPRNDSMH